MKLFFSVLINFFFLFGISNSCVGQSASVTEGCLPLSISFTAPAGSTSFFWEFGDGATSTLQDPTNVYLVAGNYTVVFREVAGGPSIGTVNISVYNKPVPTFTPTNAQGCAPLTVNFNNTTALSNGISIIGLNWVFSNGANTTGQSPSYTFTSSGVFDVSLSITTNLPSCNSTAQYSDVITAAGPPAVSIGTTPSPALACDPPLTVSFQNFSSSPWGALSYVWDFGNTNTSTAANPPDQTYGNGGYTVSLTATDNNGCVGMASVPISVGGPTASFLINDSVCIGEPVNLINNGSSGFYSWTFDGGTDVIFPTSSSDAEPTIVFNTPGYHVVNLAILGVCPHDTSITVYVQQVDPTFTTNPSFSCSDPFTVQFTPNDPNLANYFWDFGNGTISNLPTPLIDYVIPDTHTYTINDGYYFKPILYVTSALGCTDSSFVIDTIHKPNAAIYPDVIEGCVPLTVNFDDSSVAFDNIVAWEWHFGDGTIVNMTTGQDLSHTYTSVGYYGAFIIATSAQGCIDTSYIVPIRVGDTLTPNFSVGPTNVCPDETVSFTDITVGPYADSIDTWHYYSEDSRQFSCFQEPNPTWVYSSQVGAQDITMVVGYHGCYSQVTQTAAVTVNGPIAGMNYSLDCATPFIVDFTNESQDETNVSWDFGDGNGSILDDPVHTYSSTGDYTVRLIASNSGTGCADDTITMLVHIRDIQAGFTVAPEVCQDVFFELDASNSVDVFENCDRGYIYYFSDPNERPFMTDSATDIQDISQTGHLDIMLVVKDINNCQDTAYGSTIVYGITADFTVSDTAICYPVTLNGTDLSTSDTTITSWNWIFPDFQTSNLQNPSVIIDGPPIWWVDTLNTITLTRFYVENVVGCWDTLTVQMSIYNPTSNVSVNDQSVCTGSNVNFQATDYTNAGSFFNFNWTFGDGGVSTLQNPSHQYNSAGVYAATLNYAEDISGCGGTETFQITVAEFPTADFASSADSGQFVCPDDNVLFTNLSDTTANYNFAWDFGNGLTSTVEDPGTVYTTNGVYDVQFILSLAYPFGCSDTVYKTVSVQAPVGDFTTSIDDDTICRLGVVVFQLEDTSSVGQFYWDFGDGSGAGAVNPVSNQYTFVPPSGKTIAKLIMANPDGSCPLTQTKPIHIFEVVADFIRNGNDIDTAICPKPYPLTNNSKNAFSFYWDFGDGTTSTVPNPAFHNFEPGTYDVLLGVKNNALTCTDTIIKTIIVFESPEADIIGDTICEGESVTLTTLYTDVSYSYLWTSNPIFNVNNNSTFSVIDNPTERTDYFLTVTDTNGCMAFDETFVEVYSPILIPDFDTIIVIGDSIALPMPYNATDYTYTWTPATGLSCIDCPYPLVQPLSKTEYSLVISDNYGCFDGKINFIIDLHPETFISLPTTFTPNGDGNNDIIYVEGWGIKELIEYKIYNRWGELVFETADKTVGWDGYYKGILQNNDVYLVQVKGLTWADEEKSIEMYINLMR
ncbi:MAG: PKD domain-containing protein [Crocinitomicaceae bacterium]